MSTKKKVRAKRTKKYSEREIYILNSTVQNDETDFDELLVGDMSTLSTIPPHDEQESMLIMLIMLMYYHSPMNQK